MKISDLKYCETIKIKYNGEEVKAQIIKFHPQNKVEVMLESIPGRYLTIDKDSIISVFRTEEKETPITKELYIDDIMTPYFVDMKTCFRSGGKSEYTIEGILSSGGTIRFTKTFPKNTEAKGKKFKVIIKEIDENKVS